MVIRRTLLGVTYLMWFSKVEFLSNTDKDPGPQTISFLFVSRTDVLHPDLLCTKNGVNK